MRTPNEAELQNLQHMYDPVYARQYYLKNRKLKGRKRGTAEDYDVDSPAENRAQQRRALAKVPGGKDPRTGKTREQIAKEARAKQRKELGEKIGRLEGLLKKLEAKIAEKIREEKAENRESKAKKERARKEAEKPKTAAEKAEDARRNKKYREKNEQKLKSKRDDKTDPKKEKSSSGGGGRSVSDLKAVATKVRGQIAVAKQKLAAL